MSLATTGLVAGRRIACLLLALVCLEAGSLADAQSPTLQPRAGEEPITPIPAAPVQDPRRVALGEHLFGDRRLSHDNTRSCLSCHDTGTNGASANAHDVTPEGRPLALNTPTVFNSALNFRLNWEGNVRSLERETEETLRKPETMASSVDEVVSKLRADREAVRLFRDAYGSEPNGAALLNAIATYERSLVTPGGRFDRWLAGDAGAITPEELSGYQLFKSLGCISCHQGVNVGGNLFQRHGIFHPVGSAEPTLVRVPSLRNVATTPPYFHDGSAPTLSEAVKKMGVAQLDRELTDQQIAAIIAFLNTLTGAYLGQGGRDHHTGRSHGAPMRLLPGALGILLLLALLTWLLLRGIDTNAPAHAVTLKAFDDFALAEASLHRDVMQARAGVLGNYDTLGKAVEAMEDAVTRLRSHAQTEGLEAGSVDRLATTVALQEELTERFKSSNALLQNSLSYVGLLSTSPTFGAQAKQLAPAIGALAAAILHLTRDSSSDAVKALQDRTDRFAAQAPTVGRHAEAAQALLAHARLLHDLLPAVDETLKTLVAVPSRQPLEAIRAQFSDRQSVVEATAQRFRLLLYLVSLLLLIMLASLGLQLRARAYARQRRAAFEHVIAKNSTRLINCPPAETEARLKQVLGEFCRAICGERAYVVLAENPTRVVACSTDGTVYPPGWPDQALAPSAQLGAAGPDIVTVPDVAALPPGEVKDALAAAGVRGWACVPLIRPGRVRGIMGFDAFQPAWDKDFPLPVVRLAGDAVANAIEREFLERERARLTTRLERARRMQIIGSLASGIAHNFNNIIGAILGYSEMVEPQLTPGTKPAQHVDEIRRAAERGRDLIENILTFGRRRDARVRPVQVRNLYKEAASLLRATLPTGVKLIVEDVPAYFAVSGEPAELQQVILNLCTNAAQAMVGGGCIRVTAEQKDVAGPSALSHGELTPGRYLCLSVSDTGRGFDEGVARRLFEPFFTTRSAGTGLGLATVREIVHDHDGAMNVQSKPGHGSRFEAWLPAAAAGSTAAVGPTVLPLGRGETVLIVESERERLLRDEETLAALGYEPVGFERPADAIAACRAAPTRFDAVVVSQAASLPDGLGLARALHEFVTRPPILLATASTIDVSVDAMAEAGITEILRRPLVSTELAAALARCLRSPGALRT